MVPAYYPEKTAFVEVVRKHTGSLVRFARRLVGSEEDAEEIVQEALLRAYASRRALRASRGLITSLASAYDMRPSDLAGSVYRIARNLSIDYLRRKRLRLLDESVMARLPARRTPAPDEAFETEALREAVRRAVEGLPKHYRRVIALRFGLGLSYRAIARSLRVKQPTVEARLHRAKKRLKRALAPWFH